MLANQEKRRNRIKNQINLESKKILSLGGFLKKKVVQISPDMSENCPKHVLNAILDLPPLNRVWTPFIMIYNRKKVNENRVTPSAAWIDIMFKIKTYIFICCAFST